MKRKNIAILILSILAGALALFAVGCGSTTADYNPDTWEGAVVTFVLEGGEYKNTTSNISYYFTLGEGQTVKLGTPTMYSGKAVTRAGYKLTEGAEWCRVKTEEQEENEDGEMETVYKYSDPWDFSEQSKDVVRRGDRITLYANWSRVVKYTYNVCFKEGDETVVVGTYDVKMGVRFNDYMDYRNAVKKSHSKTAMPDENGNFYFDENDKPWDFGSRHPGGDTNTAINVYLHCIDGAYELVSTADELNAISATDNVYLMKTIDFGGKTLTSLKDYGGTFEGNGHTVKNFNLNRGNGRNDLYHDTIEDGWVLGISIFGDAVGAQVRNVTFENVSVDVDAGFSLINTVIVAPLFLRMQNFEGDAFEAARDCWATGVSFSGTFTVSNRGDLEDEDIVIVTDRMCYRAEDEKYLTDCDTLTFTEATQTSQTAFIDIYSDQFTRKKEY